MNKQHKILVTPLDWGLGHATRCIPIINYLLKFDCEVIIAASDVSISILKEYFPQIRYEKVKGYNVRYAKKKWQLPFVIGWQIPKILSRIQEEHNWLNDFLMHEKIDVVISDNRYGMYSTKVKSIFITHQLQIQVPHAKWLQKVLNNMNAKMIAKFSECWVVDYNENGLSGDLAQNTSLKAIEYLGNLSRFELSQVKTNPKWDLLCLLSGPEPQRTLLEQKILSDNLVNDKHILLVRGLPHETINLTKKGFSIINHLPANELSQAIQQSKLIICRAGYSTLLDLAKLNKHAFVIPTPGQTEQEYLASYLTEKKWMQKVSQDEFDLQEILSQEIDFAKFPSWNMHQFESVIDKLLENLSTIKEDKAT